MIDRRRSALLRRTGAGFGIATPLSFVLVWYMGHQGVPISPELAAAIGGVLTSLVLCLESLGGRLLELIHSILPKRDK